MSGPVKRFFKFDVMGKGHFSIDMLRYDQCFPLTGDDASNIQATYEDSLKTRTISLVACSHVRFFSPTYGRWASFGWPVVLGSFTEL